jgi:hypothetical protein
MLAMEISGGYETRLLAGWLLDDNRIVPETWRFNATPQRSDASQMASTSRFSLYCRVPWEEDADEV